MTDKVKYMKITGLLEITGHSTVNSFLDEYALNPGVPGICCNIGCDYSTDVELDSTSGWCEECNDNTVVSGLILMGVV